MGKSTINGPCSIAMQLFYSHYLCGYPKPGHLHLRPLFRLRYPMDRQGTLQPNIIPTRLGTGLGTCFPTTNIPVMDGISPRFFGTYILTYPRGSVNAIYIYMVTFTPSRLTPVMLANKYQHHGSVMSTNWAYYLGFLG